MVDGCIIIIHEVFMCDSSQWNSLWLWQLNFSCFKSYCLLKNKSVYLRHWLQNQTGLHTFKLLLLLWKANLHKMYSHTYSQHVKVLDFAPFCGSYVREFELSQSNLVNRIIKNIWCTQFEREDVELCPFYNLYEKEHILFTRLLCSNDFLNKSPPFQTCAIKLCIILC